MSVPAQQDGARSLPASRVLVYRLGSLGDMVVALPSLHLIERVFPAAERRLLTNVPVSAKAPAAKAVLGGSGLIHSYERYAVGTRSLFQLLALAWRIRRFRPDVLVYVVAARGLPVAERDAKFFRWACGVRRLVGVPLTEDMQCHRTSDDGTLEPEASRLLRNLAYLGQVDLQEPGSWDLRLTASELQRAEAALLPVAGERLLSVCVGTKVQAKDWGASNWHALLARLASLYGGYGLVLVGAAEEVGASEAAADGWRSVKGAGPVLNLCGALSPRESAAVLQRTELFVGHDSGPMHLAAAVGTPCVAIFAARNRPRVWFPFGKAHRVLYHRVDCWGCELETCIQQRKKCLLSITVEEVVQAIGEVLSRPSAPNK
ncbi:MAG: glycosyltransferase family 9 protein [Janthinobacterium lividum]